MGCDIHLYAEVKENGKWRSITVEERLNNFPEPWMLARYRKDLELAKNNPEGLLEQEAEWRTNTERDWNQEKGPDGKYPWKKNTAVQIEGDRNYDVFGMLANVRNGYGFAGVETGDGFEPISEPRGLPKDVCKEILGESDSWDGDGHSHSWLTVQELKEYFAKERNAVKSGVVDVAGYMQHKEKGQPDSWCGDTSGPGIIKVTPTEMDRICRGKVKLAEGLRPYTRVRWNVDYKKAAGTFYTETLASLSKLGNPENVRIVFWFDN